MGNPRIVIGLLLLGYALVAGCATVTGGHTVPTSARVSEESGLDPDALREGRALYTRACMDCHRQYFPGEFAPAAWESIIPDMGDRAGLSDLETHNVMLFLREASRMTRAE